MAELKKGPEEGGARVISLKRREDLPRRPGFGTGGRNRHHGVRPGERRQRLPQVPVRKETASPPGVFRPHQKNVEVPLQGEMLETVIQHYGLGSELLYGPSSGLETAPAGHHYEFRETPRQEEGFISRSGRGGQDAFSVRDHRNGSPRASTVAPAYHRRPHALPQKEARYGLCRRGLARAAQS